MNHQDVKIQIDMSLYMQIGKRKTRMAPHLTALACSHL